MKNEKPDGKEQRESNATEQVVHNDGDKQVVLMPRSILEVPISTIMRGNRVRVDEGDIEGLSESILKVGLLQPPIVTQYIEGVYKYRLVGGDRRIKAVEHLGRTTIVVVITDPMDALTLMIAEGAEDTCRKPLTPSEQVALADKLEPAEREAAKKREQAGRGRRAKGEKFTPIPKAKAMDRVAAAVGLSRPTLMKAREIVHAARKDSSLKPLVQLMDETRKVDGVFRKYIAKTSPAGSGTRKEQKGTDNSDKTETSDNTAAESSDKKTTETPKKNERPPEWPMMKRLYNLWITAGTDEVRNFVDDHLSVFLRDLEARVYALIEKRKANGGNKN